MALDGFAFVALESWVKAAAPPKGPAVALFRTLAMHTPETPATVPEQT